MRITPLTRPRLRVTAVAVAALAATAIVVPASQSAFASTTPATAVATAKTAPKPSIVLVHGAWGDSSSWDAVVGRLQADGYTVYVPPNPLEGLSTDSTSIRDFLDTISGPVILVGHSYGGAVITDAATGDANVKALVYVNAFAPDEGQAIGQLVTSTSGSCVTDYANLTLVPYAGAPAGAENVYIKQSAFAGCMANGLPAETAAVLGAVQRPLTTAAFTEASGVPAWKTIPSWAVVGTEDHAIPPAEQLAMAKTAGAHVTQVKAPHLSMVSNPGAVTAVILQAVRSTT